MIGLCLFLYLCGAAATAAFLDEDPLFRWKSSEPLLIIVWPFLILFFGIAIAIELARKHQREKNVGKQS